MTDSERRRLAKLEKKQLRCLARLGISNFESVDKTQKRQIDLIRRLRGAQIDTAGLDDCGRFSCGRVRCAEGCPFGTRRRRLAELIAIHRLITNAPGPIYEIRVNREVWNRPAGELHKVKIAAAKKLVRRALDNILNPKIVAVGTFKVWFEPIESEWQPILHLVVAGADRDALQKALSTATGRSPSLVRVNEVENLGQLVNEVLRSDLHGARQPWFSKALPAKAQRTEYYLWALRLPLGSRMIRYGCDRYFNPLRKKPRVVRPKVPKQRPYPRWLEPYMFGRGKWEDIPPHSMTFQPKNKHVRVVNPGKDYYKLDQNDNEK